MGTGAAINASVVPKPRDRGADDHRIGNSQSARDHDLSNRALNSSPTTPRRVFRIRSVSPSVYSTRFCTSHDAFGSSAGRQPKRPSVNPAVRTRQNFAVFFTARYSITYPLSRGSWANYISTGLFDGLGTLCYIESSRGKCSATMLFERLANLSLFLKASIDCRRRHDHQRGFQEPQKLY